MQILEHRVKSLEVQLAAVQASLDAVHASQLPSLHCQLQNQVQALFQIEHGPVAALEAAVGHMYWKVDRLWSNLYSREMSNESAKSTDTRGRL